MFVVLFYGWSKGAEKISLIKLLSEVAGLEFGVAKSIKDKVVDEEKEVEVIVSDEGAALQLVEKARLIGFLAKYYPRYP
jgi:hypothetical protein